MYEQFMGGAVRFFKTDRPFTTENGDALPSLRIAYHTYGTLNAAQDNVIWVCHALTANSDCADWWPNMVEQGRLLDPTRYYIVCANKLGSCYGSSSPLNTEHCPSFTVRDNVSAFSMLADHLGINTIRLLIGGSTGGAQAMEWAITKPDRVERLALLATLPAVTAWIVASSAAQRMAIRAAADPKQGLAAARAVAMLQYRGENPYNLTQTAESVVTYQEYQGQKLANRFDPDCYLRLLDTLDGHNVGQGRENLEKALGQITAKTAVIAIDTDIMFPAKEIRKMSDAIPNATYYEIHSEYGHDGFLIETPAMTALLQPLLENKI